MILIILLLVVIFLLYEKMDVSEGFSGGVNMQMNSNTVSPMLVPYVYDIKPSQQVEYADTVAYDMNHPYDVDGDGEGVTDMDGAKEIDEMVKDEIVNNELDNVKPVEGFRCGCNKRWNEDFTSGHEYVNMNAMIPSTDIINMRC
jgi:hypothetical protein